MAATLVATVALGVGVTLARAERERRVGARRRERERRFGLDADERAGAGLRRIALAQVDVAVQALHGAGAGAPEERVHEARKALKRLRALLRLLREQLGEGVYEHESAVVRDAGRRLAQARDAEVLLATLDALLAREPKRVRERGGVKRLRARLLQERTGAAERALAGGAAQGGALAQLLGLRARVATWPLDAGADVAALEQSLQRIYATGRRRMRRAAGAEGERAGRRLHEWRKRVKDLRYVAEMLDRERAGDAGGKRRARAQAGFARKVAKRADELGELLGEEHDLVVLAERVRSEARAGGALRGRGSRKALLKAIARRRRRLRRRALRDGAKLYARKPKRFARRMRKSASTRR